MKLPDRKEWNLRQFSTLKHVAKVCIDRLISVPSRGDKLETAPQQQAWENLHWRAQKAWSQVRPVPSTAHEKSTFTTWSEAEEPAQKIFFSTFNSKTFWGFTEMGCLPVCSLLSWLVRKNNLRLGFWTSDFFDPLCSANNCSPVSYNPKSLPEVFGTLKHHLQKVPTQHYKLLASLFFPHKYKLLPILQVCSRLVDLQNKACSYD